MGLTQGLFPAFAGGLIERGGDTRGEYRTYAGGGNQPSHRDETLVMSLKDSERPASMKEHPRGFPPSPSLTLAMVLCAAPAEACYHYVYYLTSGAPYPSVFAKFDLSALADKTVTFRVADTGPATASSGS